MNRGARQFLVIVDLVSTDDGGRKTPIVSGYRPNFWFGEERDGLRLMTGAAIILDARALLFPGQTTHATLIPLFPDLWRNVMVGSTIPFYEGHRKVGEVRVVDPAEATQN